MTAPRIIRAIALPAAALAVIAIAGCGGSAHQVPVVPVAHASTPAAVPAPSVAPTAGDYALQLGWTALHNPKTGDMAYGWLSGIECRQGWVTVFDSHADALAGARDYASGGTFGDAIIIGPDWVVGTPRARAAAVIRKIGGRRVA